MQDRYSVAFQPENNHRAEKVVFDQMLFVRFPRLEDDSLGKQIEDSRFSEIKNQTLLMTIKVGYCITRLGEIGTDLDGIALIGTLDGGVAKNAEAQIRWTHRRPQCRLERKITGEGDAEELVVGPAARAAFDPAVRGAGSTDGDGLPAREATTQSLRPESAG